MAVAARCPPLTISYPHLSGLRSCPQLQAELDRFESFYGEKHKNKRLEWNHSLGSAELTARFDAGVKTLTVSLYQASALLLFAEPGPSKKLSYAEIAAALRIRMSIPPYISRATLILMQYSG